MAENSTTPMLPRVSSPVARDGARLLTFLLTREEFSRFDYRHLWLGIFCTWLVGMGRWWDDAGASLLQRAGVGSVIYIFLLALLLWLVVMPLKPRGWTYRHVLTFVALTAPPALLYAIPVEKMCSFEVARMWNGWFLVLVALWRVMLLFYYLNVHARLRPFAIIVAALLPITAIIVTLTALNLHRVVFDFMGGRRGEPNPNESAYTILLFLTMLSLLLIIPLLISYIALIAMAQKKVDESEVASGD